VTHSTVHVGQLCISNISYVGPSTSTWKCSIQKMLQDIGKSFTEVGTLHFALLDSPTKCALSGWVEIVAYKHTSMPSNQSAPKGMLACANEVAKNHYMGASKCGPPFTWNYALMCHDKQESLVNTIEGLIEVWKGGGRTWKCALIEFISRRLFILDDLTS
jgi:hypothetical protein